MEPQGTVWNPRVRNITQHTMEMKGGSRDELAWPRAGDTPSARPAGGWGRSLAAQPLRANAGARSLPSCGSAPTSGGFTSGPLAALP